MHYDDLPPIEPEKTIVYGVRWEEGTYREEDGKKIWVTPSKLIFPNGFSGEIETDVGLILYCMFRYQSRALLDRDNRDTEVVRRHADRERSAEGQPSREAGPSGQRTEDGEHVLS